MLQHTFRTFSTKICVLIFGLHELAVVAGTLSDLIHQETVGRLERIHNVLNYSAGNHLFKEESDTGLEYWLSIYIHFMADRIADADELLR